ncbi:MAG TPA: hypothetical protein VL633_02800 [Bacteroidota bacterium]|nr:hypothetical protein [Bacteroidota bacterium]
MNIRIFFLFLYLSLSASTGLAQTRNGLEIDYTVLEAYSKPGSEYWASGGAGIASAGLPSSALSNPAALHFSSLGFYAEASQRFSTKWLAGIDYDGQTIVPSFVGVGFKAGSASLSFGYANTYDFKWSYSAIETTPQYPNGTGRTFDFDRTVKLHSFFGSAGYQYDEHLAVGITVGIHYVHLHDIVLTDLSADGGGFGVLITPAFIFSASEKVRIGGAVHYESTTTFFESYGLTETYAFVARFPWTADLGIAWKLTPNFEIMLSTEYQHWTDMSNNFNNLVQIHIGTDIGIADRLRLRTGFFTQQSPGTYGTENFLTAGFTWKMTDAFLLSVNGMDSHLVSNSSWTQWFGPDAGSFRQASVSLGVGYTLPTD